MTEPRSVQDLLAFPEALEYLMFWGHTPRDPGQVDKSCLSNWFPAGFTLEGRSYATTEHFMMAAKALLFEDHIAFEEICAANSPGEAKRLGRRVRGFDEARWCRERFEIVVRGNLAKFQQHDHLGAFLRSTGHMVLVEASPHDKIWGIGLAASTRAAADPARWLGLNLLGFALMEVRHRLLV